jgi:tetratricopeptide (TPR) repeat protein
MQRTAKARLSAICLAATVVAAAFLAAACSHPGAPALPAAPGSASPATADAMPGMPHLPASLADWAQGAQVFDGLGSFHRSISSHSAEAQQYFDQGMRLLWAFNHDESTRSFARAAQSDPKCAICLWGVALTVGPNYNMPMMAETRARVAYESLQRAHALLDGASPVEKALIAALDARYPNPAPLDPANAAPVLEAYAAAMRTVAQQYPADDDVQTMYAESLMNIHAWRLWSPDGQPAPGTEEIVRTLETVLARNPQHPGANHYYVHAVEASPHPDRAVAAAERLRGMMPAAGHLEHMPAHIMQRVGRYEDAAEANRKGAAADGVYLGKTRPLDYYAMYVAHNYQFLGYSTAMEGRRAETFEAMKQLRAAFPQDAMLAMPGVDWYGSEPYLALIRFGAWDEMLAEPRPDAQLKVLTGAYLFARTVALAARGHISEAQQTLAELDQERAGIAAEATAGYNSARDVLELAAGVAKAEIARAKHDGAAAIAALTAAVAKEDGLGYDEPADWFFPVRHLLGAELLKAGKAAAAEAVYREDLRRNRGNGWSLFGLAQALRAEGKRDQAAAVDREFHDAWQHADITLTASRL